MSIARIVYLYCDGESDRCDCAGGDPYLLQPVPGEDTATSQRADAKSSRDWRRVGGKDYCRFCWEEMNDTPDDPNVKYVL